MPIRPIGITVFIGGPRDTAQERGAVVEFVRNVMGKRYPANKVQLITECFDHPEHPVGAELQDDWQDNIDCRIDPGAQDCGIFIFRWRLGSEKLRDGKTYPSMSAYEIERFLAQGNHSLTVLRYEQPFDYRSELPDNLMSLNQDERQIILNSLQHKNVEYGRLESYLQELKRRLGSAPTPTFRSRDHLLNLVDDILTARIASILATPPPPKADPPRKVKHRLPGWPFFSFKSLDEEQHEIFFGREDDIKLILNDLRSPERRFLCIHGSSGTGKSSLLKAGVVPLLVEPELASQYGIPYHPSTVLVIFTLGVSPFRNFADAITLQKNTPLKGADAEELAEHLRECCEGDIEKAQAGIRSLLIDKEFAGAPAEAQLIVVIDQAEELWTRAKTECRAFLLFLAALVRNGRVRLFCTLRSDLYKDFIEFELLANVFNSEIGRFHILSKPTPDMLAKMIEGPLRIAEIERDDDFIGAIIQDVERMGNDALPLVAHTLNVMITDSGGERLTLAAYRKIGGLDGAVQTSLERVGKIDRNQLPPLFDLLYEIRNGAPVRRLVSRADLAALDIDVSDAIDRLVKARILVAGASADTTPGKRKNDNIDNIQLAHDALFDVWPELRDWIQQHRRDLEIRDELLRDAEHWDSHGHRSRHIRLRPEALAEIIDLSREKPYLFRRTPVIGRYLKAADELHQREVLIRNLKGRHLGAALDAYLKGGRLTKEDRGTEPEQLNAAFYAAVTGDDRDDGTFDSPGRFSGKNAGPSIFDNPKNVQLELTGGLVPLEAASLFGQLSIVKKLIARGANPNRKSPGVGSTALDLAAYGGQLRIVRFYVEECGMDPDIRDNENASPLLWAFNRGHEDVAAYLMEHGAPIDVEAVKTDTKKIAWTTVTEAVRGGNLRLVEFVYQKMHFSPDQETEIGATPLGVACQKGNSDQANSGHLSIAEALLGVGATVDGLRPDWRPLILATSTCFTEMMKLLLSRGANPDIAASGRNTPLHSAASLATSLPTRILLKSHANPNIVDESTNSPISCAAANGRDEIVEVLLDGGADPELCGEDGWTALQFAADDGDPAITRLLLEKGAQPDRATAGGWTPLLLAASSGNMRVAELLLEHHANPNARIPKTGETALHLAAQSNSESLIALLLIHGVDPQATNSDGKSALHVALDRKSYTIASLLIESMSDVNAYDAQQRAALHIAVEAGELQIVQALVKKDAICTMLALGKFSPLHLACLHGNEKIVELLLRSGSIVDQLGAMDATPLLLACSRGNTSIVRTLLDAGASIQAEDSNHSSSLHVAISACSKAEDAGVDLVHLLLERGANLNKLDNDGDSPLHIAALEGNANVAQILIEAEAEVNLVNLAGRTPLIVAARSGSAAICGMLLDHGAKIDASENRGLTALHSAALAGSEPAARLLIERGAEINARGKGNLRPLHLAAASGVAPLVQLLIQRGADLSARTIYGATPMMIAQANLKEQIGQILSEAGAVDNEGVPDVKQEFTTAPDAGAPTRELGAWEELDTEESRLFAADVDQILESIMISNEISVRKAALPFFSTFHLVAITDNNHALPNVLRFLWKPGKARLLDWTNAAIYQTYLEDVVTLDSSNAIAYAKFFFANVHRKLGRFDIVEDVSAVRWTDEATESEKKRVAELLIPVSILGIDEEGRFVLTCTTVLKDAIFRTNIRIATQNINALNVRHGLEETVTIGQGELSDEQLLAEDLHINIDVPPINAWS